MQERPGSIKIDINWKKHTIETPTSKKRNRSALLSIEYPKIGANNMPETKNSDYTSDTKRGYSLAFYVALCIE